jgi:hypothetical protein
MEFRVQPPFVNEAVDMPWPTYLEACGVNPSRIVKGFKSMKSFRYYEGSDKPERGKLVGSLTHCLVLEPEKFSERYAVFDGIRREDSKKYQEWLWLNDNKEAVKPDEYEQARVIADAVLSHRLARSFLDAVKTEVSLFAEINGVQCKGRVDGLSRIILDLKTTTNVEMQAFGRVFGSLDYGAKLAAYKRFAEQLGYPIDGVFVISVENKGEYDVAVVEVPQIVLDNGWSRVEKVIDRIPECVERDHWPGVAENGLYELSVPNWSMDESELLDWSE